MSTENTNSIEELLTGDIDLGEGENIGMDKDPFADINGGDDPFRSEERRVGKECL